MSAPTHERIMDEAERIKALGEASESQAPYEVNQPTIGTWLDAMGYENERFRTGEAPPSMAQVWTMPGLGRRRPDDDPLSRMMEILTDEGYTAVLGTNCEQSYERYLRVGEQLRVTTALDSVVGPKNTAMGEGYFVTSRNTWYVGDEVVATMLFRVLKFIPKEKRRDPPDDGPGLAVLLGRHRRRGAPDPEVQRVRRAPLPARPDLRRVRRRSTAATSSRPAPARCSRTSCTGTRRSPARSCRS